MSVPSFAFLAFALIAAGVFRLARTAGLRQAVLLIVNLLFLASFTISPMALAPFAGFLIFGYLAFLLMQAGRRRALPALIVATLVLFCWLKKYTFIPPQFWLQTPYLTLGLSYVFFRVLHLIIDAGEGGVPYKIPPLAYINYTLNFTCLVAGPIQRYPDYQQGWTPVSVVSLGVAVERIILGFFKVLVVSALLDGWHKDAIAAFAASGGPQVRIASATLILAIYPLYLYANFSGYTDTVIGVARLFGLTLPENFDRPFMAANYIDFWSRWHMSLSNWLKTYVYNPLLITSMRHFPSDAVTPYLAVFAFFATFFLVGAWHGQTAEFLFFGVLQGGGMSLNKLYQILTARWLGRPGYRRLCANPVYALICRGLTFTYFTFSLLWFWTSWTHINVLFRGLGVADLILVCMVIIAAAALALQVFGLVCDLAARWRIGGNAVFSSRYVRTVGTTTLATVLLFVSFVLAQAPPDIVYKAF